MAAVSRGAVGRSVSLLSEWASPSWTSMLTCEPGYEKHGPNRTSRPVKSGHYVPVRPTPIPSPKLVALSHTLLSEWGLDAEDCRSDPQFLRLFSGDVDDFSDALTRVTWATPYALSIYGEDMYQNCPFGTGDGYGDGRAVSIGEFVTPKGQRWELQLKGGGQTPFCRGGDGRCVLRSCVREFVACEAMAALRVPTTRALSVIVSQDEVIRRPWYSGKSQANAGMDDAALASLPPPFRMMMLMRLNAARDPDVMREEAAAVTCRVSPSFLRVGHIQLFGRRVVRDRKGDDAETIQNREKELAMIIRHAIFREYPEIQCDDLQEQILSFLNSVSQRLASLTADWVRVGYCQGNFNSDNCLVGGRTMDYGPFGFIEKFTPFWNMWVGGGEHFGFLNQPTAGAKNFESLVRAVMPLLDENGRLTAERMIVEHENRADAAMEDVWRRKLGLLKWNSQCDALIAELIRLLDKCKFDYTLFWRNLAEYPAMYFQRMEGEGHLPEDPIELLKPLEKSFYGCDTSPLPMALWIRKWFSILKEQLRDNQISGLEVTQSMKQTSPKYVPREWMLVASYQEAERGDYRTLETVARLLEKPYDEQEDMADAYFRKADDRIYSGVGTGGVTHMT